MNDILAVDKLDVRHGLLQAVRGVSFSVAKGEIVAFVGANGAGKTTLFRAIAGAHRPAAGRVFFHGTDVTLLPDYERVRRGIVLVPEGRRLFTQLSVRENLMLAGAVGRPGRWDLEAVLDVFPNLSGRLNSYAGNLSGGEQQATAIGRALMTNPDVILLDEISLGLSPAAVGRVYDSLENADRNGDDNLAGRTGSQSGAVGRRSGRLHAGGKDRRRRAGSGHDAGADHGRLFRTASRRGAGRGHMMDWINSIIQGVLLGGYYSLIACGLAFMFQVMRIINLAHGTLAVVAGFAIWIISEHFDISPFVGAYRRLAGDGRRRLDPATRNPRTQRAGEPACAAARNIRARDRYREPAVRGIRGRHALARALYRHARL